MRRISVALLIVWWVVLTPSARAAAGQNFPETGFSIEGRFLQYWQANGGLSQFGYPISPTVTEAGEDGVARSVQYFERNRFELHPDKAQPFDVLLSRLGVASLARRGTDWSTLPRGGAAAGCEFFAATGQSLCEPFLSYWRGRGGLAIFGMPISTAQPEISPTDGRTYLVQYFERNRFEHHPENPDAYRVQLGLLGSEIYGKATAPAPAPVAPEQQRMLDLINAARREAGLTPVTISGSLTAVAASYSAVQAAQGGINHTGPDGSTLGGRITRAGYSWAACAENLAAGYPGVDEVFASWMNSAGHRANILKPNMREIGIGHTRRDDDPKRFFDYWVLVLAAPR